MSKYIKVTALVPNGEHFDESAVGEGVWLSANHLNSIEGALAIHDTALQAVQTQLDAANLTAGTNTATINDLTTQLSTANTTISDRDAEIVRLNAEVTRLSGKPSGSGTKVIGAKADESAEEKETTGVRFDDPNHPANVAADKALAKYSGWRKK